MARQIQLDLHRSRACVDAVGQDCEPEGRATGVSWGTMKNCGLTSLTISSITMDDLLPIACQHETAVHQCLVCGGRAARHSHDSRSCTACHIVAITAPARTPLAVSSSILSTLAIGPSKSRTTLSRGGPYHSYSCSCHDASFDPSCRVSSVE